MKDLSDTEFQDKGCIETVSRIMHDTENSKSAITLSKWLGSALREVIDSVKAAANRSANDSKLEPSLRSIDTLRDEIEQGMPKATAISIYDKYVKDIESAVSGLVIAGLFTWKGLQERRLQDLSSGDVPNHTVTINQVMKSDDASTDRFLPLKEKGVAPMSGVFRPIIIDSEYRTPIRISTSEADARSQLYKLRDNPRAALHGGGDRQTHSYSANNRVADHPQAHAEHRMHFVETSEKRSSTSCEDPSRDA